MSLNAAEIHMVAGQLAPLLEGGRIMRIDRPNGFRVVLQISNRANIYRLLIAAYPGFGRLHLLTAGPRVQGPARGFCNVLRQHLTGSSLEKISVTEGCRIVELICAKRDALMVKHRVSLFAEFTESECSLILADASGKVFGAQFGPGSKRRLSPGAYYSPPRAPAPPAGKAERNRFASGAGSGDVFALSRAIGRHYEEAEARDRFERCSVRIEKRLKDEKKRLEALQHRLRTEIAEAEGADRLRKDGELLTIALPDIDAGRKIVTVRDLYADGSPERCIELNPHISLQENIGRIFRRYKELKRSLPRLRRISIETGKQVKALENSLVSLDNIGSLRELHEFEIHLKEKGLPAGGKGRPELRNGETGGR